MLCSVINLLLEMVFGLICAGISDRAGNGNVSADSGLSFDITKLTESACSTAVSHLVVPKPTLTDVGTFLLPPVFLHPVWILFPVVIPFQGLQRIFRHPVHVT